MSVLKAQTLQQAIDAGFKTCRHCGQEKPRGMFPANRHLWDRLSSWCKVCHRESSVHYYWYGRKHPKRTDQEQRLHCRDYQREYKRRERQTEVGKARVLFNMAVMRGDIIRPRHCSQCGDPCVPHGHHQNYSLPYEVVWVCRSDHYGLHRIMRQEAA